MAKNFFTFFIMDMKCQNINTNTYPKLSFKAKSINPITKPIEKPIKKEVKTLGPLVLSGLGSLGIISKKNQIDSNTSQELSDKEFNKIKNQLICKAEDSPLLENIITHCLSKKNIAMFEWIVNNKNDLESKNLSSYIYRYGESRLPQIEQVFYTPDIPHEHAAGILNYSNADRNEVDTDIKKYRKNRAKINELKPLIENYPVKDSKKQNKQSVLEYLNHPPYTQNMEYITYDKLVDFIENNEHSILDYDILFSKDEETFDTRMDFAKIFKYYKIDDDFIDKNLNYMYQNEYPMFSLFSHLKKYNSDFFKKLIQVDNHNLTNVIMIAGYIKESNIEFFKKLCNDDRFYDWLKNDDNDLIEELEDIDESNVDIVDELYEHTKDINKDDFINLMRDIIKTNRSTVELCKAYGINPIIGVGNTINSDNAPVIKKIIDSKKYQDNEIIELAKLCKHKQSIQLLEVLGTDEREFDIETIKSIFNNLFADNSTTDNYKNIPKPKFDAIMQIAKCKDIPENIIYHILIQFSKKRPINFIAKLCTDKNFPKDQIYQIASNLDEDNLPAAKALVECKKVNPEDISTILENTRTIKKEDIPYELLDEDVLSWNPYLVEYPMDSWKFVVKNGFDQKMWNQMLEKNPIATSLLSTNVGIFSDYAKANNPHITDIHLDFMNDAVKNKNLLKSWGNDLPDEELYASLFGSDIINALGKLGKGVLESKFSATLEGLEDFCEDIAAMNLTPEQYEKLALKIYPENSQKYLELEKEVSGYRHLISRLLTKEELDARKSLSLKISKYELRLKNEGVDKKAIKQKIKELKTQKQAILYNSKNAKDIKGMMKIISEDLSKMKKIASQKVNLSPQEIADKVQVLAQLPGVGIYTAEGFKLPPNSDTKNVNEYLKKTADDIIDLIQPATKENEEKWNEFINKLIYSSTRIGYKKELSDKLELNKSKYVSKIYTSDNDFYTSFDNLLEQINSHLDLSIEEAIDIMDQNMETRHQYTELGVDYDKWTKVDKNSYISVKTKLNIGEAKAAAIKNLEEDLNDMVKMVIPDEQLISFHKRLNDSGYKMYKGDKVLYDEDGFKIGTKPYGYLYKDDKPIEFEDLNKVINVIKEELNRNEFWSTTNEDENIEIAREHLYHHLMKLRPAEIDNAKNIKEGEVIDVEVRKTNMYDIKKALGLGNDAACCTALGSNFNEWTAPNYIMDKCIGAIELTDKGNYAGNTMIYLAKVDGELSLILDNIEMKTKYQFNPEIRDAFFAYARKLCGEIGKPNMPIYAGPNRHKVDMSQFKMQHRTMNIVGDSGENKVYLDFIAAACDIKPNISYELDLYRIS